MLYHLTIGCNGFSLVCALTVTMMFIAITFAKEKKDERTRA